MPTYEYKCGSCAGRVEVFQRITDDPLTTCESCGGVLKRVFFPVGVVYKGSGFYTTDYARKNGGGKAGEGAAPEPGEQFKKEEKEAAAAAKSTDAGADD